MAGLQDMMQSSFSNMQALMSPEFNKVLDNRLAVKNNSNQADQNIANMSISEALQNGIGNTNQQQFVPQAPVQQVYAPQQAYAPQQQAYRAPALGAGVVTEARDFSYLDGSNMKFEQEKLPEEEVITPEQIKESKLPDFIKQSFLETPPATGVLPKDNVDLFAEQLIAKGVIPRKQEAPKKQVIRETVETKVAKDGDNVPTKYYDYQSADIQNMIDEIVKKHINILYKQLKKDMVSVANQILDGVDCGNTLSTIKIGDSLRFVDGEGNVYEADLHFVGNKKQKGKQ